MNKTENSNLDDCTHVAPKGEFKVSGSYKKTENSKIEEGCGKDLKKKVFEGNINMYCGIEVFISEKIGMKVILCPECKAKFKGYNQAFQDVEKIIDSQIKETPYPKDIFIEPTKEQWRKIADLFEDNNFTQDKYFGSEARRVWKLSLEELKTKLKQLGK